jgi:integrase
LKTGGDGAKPLLRDDLLTVLEAMGGSLLDQRDRALLTLGFAGALRRSELVALTLADVSLDTDGIEIRVRRSKTDPYGIGQTVWIAAGNMKHCPKLALGRWIPASGIETGPLFRRITANGNIAERSLSGEAVSLILRRRLVAAGLNPDGFSGHSLRAGFVTSAALAGVPTGKFVGIRGMPTITRSLVTFGSNRFPS